MGIGKTFMLLYASVKDLRFSSATYLKNKTNKKFGPKICLDLISEKIHPNIALSFMDSERDNSILGLIDNNII